MDTISHDAGERSNVGCRTDRDAVDRYSYLATIQFSPLTIFRWMEALSGEPQCLATCGFFLLRLDGV